MKKGILSFILLFTISLLCVEVASFIYISSIHKKIITPNEFFSKNKKFGSQEDCSWPEYISHHPLLNIRYKKTGKCQRPGINFDGLVDLNQNRNNENSFKILIVGGSVAEGLYESGLLERSLNERYVAPKNTSFSVVNGAIAAGQQPRQVVASLILGKDANLVVSLEGYNELFNMQDRFDINNPPQVWHELEEILLVNRDNSKAGLIIKLISSGLSDWVKAGLLRYSFSGAAIVQASAIINNQLDSNIEYKNHKRSDLDKKEFEQEYVEKYKDYIKAMHAISNSRGTKTIVFLQPVPLIGKRLTKRELQVSENSNYKEQYQKIINKLSELDVDGLSVVPLTMIFKDYEGELYDDQIHFLGDSLGKRILADAMADAIAKKLKLKNLEVEK